MRRIMANRAICDDADHRAFADDPEKVTCEACRAIYAKEADDWHRDLTRKSRAAREAESLLDEIPATLPSKGTRTTDVEE